MLSIACPAQAQDQRPTGYPRSANEQTDTGLNLSALYTVEVRGVAAGGIDRGARYLDNLDLQVALDADRLVGWHGARLFFYGIHNNGRSFSPALVGDLQGVSNVETGVRAARLFEAWVEQDVGRRASIRLGLYNLNAEFDTTQSGGLFLLSSHGIGPDYAQSGRKGPSIFPVTSLALRGEIAVGDNVLLRAAVLDGVPGDEAHPKRTAIKLSRRDGALIAGEADYLKGGTKAGVGGWAYTAPADTLVPDAAARRHGDKGIYAYAEHRLTGDRTDDPEGFAGWLRVGFADTRFQRHRQLSGRWHRPYRHATRPGRGSGRHFVCHGQSRQPLPPERGESRPIARSSRTNHRSRLSGGPHAVAECTA